MKSNSTRYARAASEIAQAIQSGEFRGKLPAERDLGLRFEVGRATIRRSLQVLRDMKLIVPEEGRGWRTNDEPLSEPPNALLSFSELAARQGREASSREVEIQESRASLDEATSLDIVPGALLLDISRLRCLDDAPLVLQRSKLVLERLAGFPRIDELDLRNASLYGIMEKSCGIVVERCSCGIEARSASREEALALSVTPGAPLLFLNQLCFDQYGRAVELHWSSYPGDRYRYEGTLWRHSHGGVGVRRYLAGGEAYLGHTHEGQLH